ncbi:uncharacterized protein LOC34620346 [Cyclospora cayetanensis]|uniref:Uncharacterized protein LOC34620346 n=1 Tax=Cyclospora cayetanensis TaxID=88456 RepID=A0A6P5WC79_9EIME|nr:uncharacterized protein LOC34620346 [Cyclospora cayetanensis]
MRNAQIVLFLLLLSGSCASEAPPAVDEALPQARGEPVPSRELHGFHDLLSSSEEVMEGPSFSEASLELRRLSAVPPAIPRRKGFPALLGSLGLLGHAGYQASMSWNTAVLPAPLMSLMIDKARFDTQNLALFSLAIGLFLLYQGIKRRLRSHQQRARWRVDELLRQDRIRMAMLSGARGK